MVRFLSLAALAVFPLQLLASNQPRGIANILVNGATLAAAQELTCESNQTLTLSR